MGVITSVRAYANNEVAYIAWDIDAKIAGCLGFEVVRIYVDEHGNDTGERVPCASWVPFKGQRNPYWLPQTTSVWPIQKLSWRDLTLRKKRDGLKRRPDEARVRYEIRAVGDSQPGLPAVPGRDPRIVTVAKRDSKGKPVNVDGKPVMIQDKEYTGGRRQLCYLGPAVSSNPIHVTMHRGKFRSTFTNGILAAQWLGNVLLEDGIVEPNELMDKLENPNDPHRRYLAGDVLPLIRALFGRKGEFYLGLYELEDKELQTLLIANKDRIHVILSNTSAVGKKWDERNKPARKALVDAGVDIQHRMFNNSTHIGHNKFVVHVGTNGKPKAVLTGSTNWTSTGVAGQTNNALLIEDAALGAVFLDYWNEMKKDALKVPTPFSKAMGDAQQSAAFRSWNKVPRKVALGNGTSVTAWFSPNTTQRRKPTSKTNPAPTPPDLSAVYGLMRRAKEAILFLAFYPGQKGNDCIIGEVIDIGINDRTLLVHGAVSSAQAMPNYVPDTKDSAGNVIEGESPSTFDNENVSIVRAARLDDRRTLGDFGYEQLTAKGAIGAIIHDKLVVIDPRSPDCHVILGSHNLGFKASYSNDENLLVVSGDRALAEAYAVHILDVYDHYRFRAIETERRRKGKKGWSGFLDTDDAWQEGYVTHRKGALMRYFAGP